MNDSSVVQALGQVETSEAGEILRSWLRGEMRMLLTDILAEEVTQLCGEPYSPDSQSRCRRAGGTFVGVRVDGAVERIRKPRVRQHEEDGSSREVGLRSYGALRRADDLRDRILRAVAVGVSTRDQRALHPESEPSRSAVSRAWIVEGRRRLEALRQRDIGSERFFCLVLDGIGLSDDLTAIAALGITLDGRKVMLDFEVGASESTAVCDGLLARLADRGLSFDGAPLAGVMAGQSFNLTLSRMKIGCL